MTSLAILAKEAKLKVTGSDAAEVFVTDEILKRSGITWRVGFGGENLKEHPDLVVVTGAWGGMTNPEAVRAKLRGLKVVMQGKALGIFMEGYTGISVAGSHGKTTTAAILAFLLVKAGFSPTFAVGCGDIPSLSGPAHLGRGKYFVAEADEYATCPQTDKTPKFFWQNPKILIITNIEYDHPDVFANLNQISEAFFRFAQKIPATGLLIGGIDNPQVKKIFEKITIPKVSYGFGPYGDWRIMKVNFSEGKTNFWVEYQGLAMGQFTLLLPGKHNALNALAAIVAGVNLGIPLAKIRQILPDFSGTKRRFEFIGEISGIKLYDDYAHHPTEISATLQAAKVWFGQKRIIAVFQPHTYSRTRALFSEFGQAFKDAQKVILTAIYASAREEEDSPFLVKNLAQEIAKHQKEVIYLAGKKPVVSYLSKIAKPGDIILTMGAGDIFRWHKDILNAFGAKG